MKNALTAGRLKEVLLYDPQSGLFFWRVAKWDLRGRRAGCKRADGYVLIRVDGVLIYAHRLAWLYMTGEWPGKLIDHVDTDKGNNRWNNLRAADHITNSHNVRKPARSSTASGLLGVQRNHGGWQATITVAGKRSCLGTFSTPEEAHAAYVAAKRELHVGCTL